MPRIRTLVFCIATLITAHQSQAGTYSQEQAGSVGFPDSTPVVLTFTGALPAASDGTLSLIADGGELALNNKRLEQLMVEGMTYQTPGSPAGWFRPSNFLDDVGATPSPVTIPLAELSGYVADGQVEVSVVRPGFISGGSFRVLLEYTTIPEPTTTALAALAGLAVCAQRRRLR